MEIVIIAAVAEDGAIGRDNALLWHIAGDMRHFRRTTMGCPVIMGYRTWLSIGRPLPGRMNIVITKKQFDAPEGVVQAGDIHEAIAAASECHPTAISAASEHPSPATSPSPESSSTSPGRCFIIGGAKTYERSMNIADTLLITHVGTTVPDADAHFPAIDPTVWSKVSETEQATDPESGLAYTIATYRRRLASSGLWHSTR